MKKASKGMVIICVLIFTLLFLSGGVMAEGDEPIITTVAGGGIGSAVLNEPHDVLKDSFGNLIIADTFNSRLIKIAPDGTTTTIAGGGSIDFPTDGDLGVDLRDVRPKSIEIDEFGNIYFHILTANKIFRMSPDGVLSTYAGNGMMGYSGDGGMAVNAEIGDVLCLYFDDEGNMYFSQAAPFCIRKIDTDGIITTVAGTGAPGYSGDNGLATDAQVLLVFGIAKDNADNLYFTEFYNDVVRKIDSNGIITTFAGTGARGYSGDGEPSSNATFDGPMDIVINEDGEFFITDYYNTVIRKIDQSGVITTIAGNGIQGADGDGGPASVASLYYPRGMSFDSNGNMLIADSYNHRIRMVEYATKTTLSFDGNGSTSGSVPDPIQGEAGETILITETGSIQKDGFVFDGWSTTPGYDGITYDPPAYYTFGEEDNKLYARWIPADYYYHIENGEARILRYIGTDSAVVIPDTIEDYPVTNIFDNAFYGLGYVTSVSIPDSVTSIGESSFEGTGLTEIDLPENLLFIYRNAFRNCHLKNITFHYGLREIGKMAFAGNSLTTITLPDSVISVGNAAFAGMDAAGITFGTGFSDIWYVWAGQVTGHIAPPAELIIPAEINGETIWYVGEDAFRGVGYISSVKIEQGITDIMNDAFRENSIKYLELSESINFIGIRAFYDNDLTTVIMPDHNVFIAEQAFAANPEDNPVELTIYGIKGSDAQRYSEQYGNTFIPKIEIRFFNWNGEFLELDFVLPGQDAVPPVLPDRYGYTFLGWSGPYQGVVADADLTALYTINQYTVTFESYFGPEVPSVTQDYFSRITNEPILKLSNYKFIGWYYDEEFIQEVNFPFILTKDVTLYARWIHCPDFNNKDKIMK